MYAVRSRTLTPVAPQMRVLVLNAGSSSLKASALDGDATDAIARDVRDALASSG